MIEGLEFSPWDAFAFIDNSIDDCNVPYAGPRGDWPGAARREEYADAQQALYSGYTHRHGIRVGTCFRPDGICTVFGPVSARHHDASVLRTSNLNGATMMARMMMRREEEMEEEERGGSVS